MPLGIDRVVVDTNVLLSYPQIITEQPCVILACVLREIEKHKISRNNELQYQARKASRYIKENEDNATYDFKDYEFNLNSQWDGSYVDNMILQACIDNKYTLLTNDILLYLKAKGLGLTVWDYNADDDKDYTGYKEVWLTEEEVAELYSNLDINTYGLHTNEYLVIHMNNELVKVKWDGQKYSPLKYKTVNKVKPINTEQELLFDMLQNQKMTIKCCTGLLGSGKDFIMLTHALNYIDSGKFDKIVWARNPIEVAGVTRLGFMPGNLEEKSYPHMAPLIDHIGEDQYKSFLAQGKLQIQQLSTIRGRDVKNAIIYVTECQNSTREHMQLLITRVGHGAQLWVNGDTSQIDSHIFSNNCGLSALKNLKGQKLFGQVELTQIERSETAKLAMLL